MLPQWLHPHRCEARWLLCLRFFEEAWSQQPLELSAEDDLVQKRKQGDQGRARTILTTCAWGT